MTSDNAWPSCIFVKYSYAYDVRDRVFASISKYNISEEFFKTHVYVTFMSFS